jgi:catechol 2,3-dioxygenase-like lactoylglutathione lyase family enzyme
MIQRLDHIALCVEDIEASIDFFTKRLNFRIGRRGTHNMTGRPIVFLWEPGSGVKFELIEVDAGKGGVDHFAFISDDVQGEVEAFTADGMPAVRGPKRTETAKMLTAHFVANEGMKVQVCYYDEGAEDTLMPDA